MDDHDDAAKHAAGRAASTLVEAGMTLGLGTGTTARWFIEAVGDLVRAGLRVSAVATSLASATLATSLGIPLVELDRHGVDLAVDGADVVDPDLRLIKGRGGALVRERIVAAAARRFVVVADEGKLRSQLAGIVPVELLSFGWRHTLSLLDECGAHFAVRLAADGEPARTDNGNLIADGDFSHIADPEGLAARLDAIPGAVGHGLFLGMADQVIVGAADGSTRVIVPAASERKHAREATATIGETLSWRAIKEGWKVFDQAGTEIGTVQRLIAEDQHDIFRGVEVRRGRLATAVDVLSNQIHRIDQGEVHTTLAAGEVAAE